MTTYPTWAAGQRVTAALLSGMQTNLVIAGGATSNATTTLADAAGLSFVADANATYQISLRVAYDAPVATDMKALWTVPAGAAMVRYPIVPAAATADNFNTSVRMDRRGNTSTVVGGGPASVTTNTTGWWEDAYLTTVSAGTVQFQIAANAAGTATLQASSYLTYVRVA